MTTSRWYNTGLDWSDVDSVSLSLWINQEPVMQPVPVLGNGPPTGANKMITMRANGTYAFATSDFGFSDSDTGDSLAKIQITTLQSAGSLKLDGTQVTLNQEMQASAISGLVFEPISGASGSPYATFQFKVSDGAAYISQANTITINIQSEESTPTEVGPLQLQQPATDETAPVITLKSASQMTIPVGSIYVEPGYMATDREDGDLTGSTGSVTVTGTVDATQVGMYTIYYDVTDGSGNAAIQQARTVSVVYETAPVPDLQAGLPDVVKRYDADGSGIIEQDEWKKAVEDYENGLLTNLEIYAISKAR